MRHLLTIALLLLATAAFSQAFVKGTGIRYDRGVPTVAPDTTYGTELVYDLDNRVLYMWDRTEENWVKQLNVTRAAGVPSGDPGDGPDLYVNTTTEDLYWWSGAGWDQVNGGGESWNHVVNQDITLDSFWVSQNGEKDGVRINGNDIEIKSFPTATTTLKLSSISGTSSLKAIDSDSDISFLFNTSSDYASLQFNGLVNYRLYKDYQTIIPSTSQPVFTPSTAYFYLWPVRPSGVGSGVIRYQDGSGAVKTVATTDQLGSGGGGIVAIPSVENTITTSTLTLGADTVNIWHIDASANQDTEVTLANPINGNIYTLQFSENTDHDTITLNDFYLIDSVGSRDTLAGIYAINSVIQAYYDTAFQVISCIPNCSIKVTTGGGPGPGPTFDVDYQAVLDYATTQGWALPDDTIQTKQNQLVVDLKAASLWDSLVVFSPYASTDLADSSFSLINWVDPSLHLQTKEGLPVYVAGEGWQGGTVNDYLETNYDYSGRDEGSIGAWLHTTTTGGSSFMFGASNENTASVYIQAYNVVINDQYSKWTTSEAPVEGNNHGAGLQTMTQGGGNQKAYLGATEIGAKSSTTANVSNYSVNVLRVNALSPSIFSDSTVTLSAFFIGDFYSASSVSALNTALNTYISGL